MHRLDEKGTDLKLVQDVRQGLGRSGQKELHSRYFYDSIGSALFEVITHLPEYGLTRAEARLLERHSPELVDRLAQNVLVSELGSGNGRKTRWVLSALAQRYPVDYLPIDVSSAALSQCKIELEQIDGVRVLPLEHDYIAGLNIVTAKRPTDSQLLLLFLGSTIGNFDRLAAAEFLRTVRDVLQKGDVLYLGTDLEKPRPQLLAAYNDAIGVTAAFNLNILYRLNKELGADFALDQFEHMAIYNEQERRVEMYLKSNKKQQVLIPAADLALTFEAEETIWTENSHKFKCNEVIEMGEKAGFRCEVQFKDEEWLFALSVLVAE